MNAIPSDQEVLALLTDYAAAWQRNDAEQIADFWAPDRFLFYKAEEVEAFFHRWDEVMEYWRNNESLHQAIALRFTQPSVKGLADGLAVASVRMRWDIRFAEDARLPDGAAFAHRGQAMGGHNHVLVMLCATTESWRLCGWSETPDAAITYLRRLYMAGADPERT